MNQTNKKTMENAIHYSFFFLRIIIILDGRSS